MTIGRSASPAKNGTSMIRVWPIHKVWISQSRFPSYVYTYHVMDVSVLLLCLSTAVLFLFGVIVVLLLFTPSSQWSIGVCLW